MNMAWPILRLYNEGSSFLHIKGKCTLNIENIDRPLLKRAIDSVKRGFGTASQGPTHKLLALVARSTGYNKAGFAHSTWGAVSFYVPRAAADEYGDFCDAVETLMHLEGSAHRRAYRDEKTLHFAHSANLTGEKRKRLRAFLKDQAKKWAVYRQPMLDFLNDPTRSIVWEFDSSYKGEGDE